MLIQESIFPVTSVRARLSSLALLLLLIAALPLRAAIATVFWNSGTTKLADWSATLALFADEYRVPLLPTEVAATLAASIELSMPVLLVLGLFTRPAALVPLYLRRPDAKTLAEREASR